MPNTEEDVKRYLKDANEAVLKAAHRGTVRAGLKTAELARDYAPRSPSEAEKRTAKRDPKPAKRGPRRQGRQEVHQEDADPQETGVQRQGACRPRRP